MWILFIPDWIIVIKLPLHVTSWDAWCSPVHGAAQLLLLLQPRQAGKAEKGKEGRLKGRMGRALWALQLSRAGLQLFSSMNTFIAISSLFSESRRRCSLRRNSCTAKACGVLEHAEHQKEMSVRPLCRCLFCKARFWCLCSQQST